MQLEAIRFRQGRAAVRRRDDGYLTLFLALMVLTLPRAALAVPSFASQTGKPCAACHTLAYGPALTAYGRQFKLNAYTFDGGEQPVPVAVMAQGGFSHTDVAVPGSAPAGFADNNNL